MAAQRITNRIETSLAARSCRLCVIHGAEVGAEIPIPAAGVVVGADRAADIVISDPAVSRRHCAIRPTPQGFEIADLGSRNGTFLDNIQVTRAAAPAGAVIRIGSSLLQLVPAQEPMVIPPSDSASLGGLIGDNPAMRQIYALLERASQSNAPILLMGESGTGKELAARAVHDQSPRRRGPFVIFDCGAASDALIESDLFGHVRGAFTGAESDRAGAFERARGGTLFLDELGDLPLPLQRKLLRVLDTGESMPVGGKKYEHHDVRVVAATHHDLAQDVRRGAFRGDLYYRIAVVELIMPPLRRRLDDVEPLARAFLLRDGVEEASLQSANLERLLAYSFPGNVRELRNVIARAVALSPPGTPFAEMPILFAGAQAAREEAPIAAADAPYHEARADVLARFERDYLRALLARAGNNVSEAARLAGVGRKLLYTMLSRTGLAAGLRAPEGDDA